jgi:hypothetical protein
MSRAFVSCLAAFLVMLSLPASGRNADRNAAGLSQGEIVSALLAHYRGNEKFERCMHKLNDPPKPLSMPSFYRLTLAVAAYAEGIVPVCR